jgi:hypothetical protein
MRRAFFPWSASLLLVLTGLSAGSMLLPLHPGLPAAPSGQPALSAATQSLTEGQGPGWGRDLACSSIGTLSVGCGTSTSARGSPHVGTGWGLLCGYSQCPPAARGGAGLAYDPITGYVVLFGGIVNLTTAANTTFADTWTFANGVWTQLHIPGPSARLGEYMAYDYFDHYILLFGGGPYLTLNSSLYYSDTWEFQNGTWTALPESIHPDARGLGGLTWDAADGYLLMYGGMSSQYDIHEDTWTFVGGLWHNLSVASHPPPLLSPGLAYDPAAGYVLLYSGATPSPNLEFGDDLEQTWSYSGGQWTNLTGSIAGTPPDGRILFSMAYDPAQGYIVLYGGWNTTANDIFGDTWIFLDDSWTQLFLSPTPNTAVIGANLISTTPNAGLLFFGGIVGSEASYHASNATWAFGPPPANTTIVHVAATPYDLTVSAAPSACLTFTLNASTARSGTTLVLPAGAYNISAPACPGYSFAGWFTTGAATVVDPTSTSTVVDVVGNGSLTLDYVAAAGSHYATDVGPLAAVVVGAAALLFLVFWVDHRRRSRQLTDAPTTPSGAG